MWERLAGYVCIGLAYTYCHCYRAAHVAGHSKGISRRGQGVGIEGLTGDLCLSSLFLSLPFSFPLCLLFSSGSCFYVFYYTRYYNVDAALYMCL